MESPAIVTSLTPEQALACRALDEAALGGIWSVDQWIRELTETQRICLGQFEGSDLCALACGWLVVDELHVTAVAVAPLRRRQGLGQGVLQALLQRGAAAGAVHATLEVASCNSAAISLYQRCGFTTAGCRRGYYSDGRDALIQWVCL